MGVLTVTTRGQVTLRKDLLRHMGLRPGEKLEAEKLPDGQIVLRPTRPSGEIKEFIGLLAGKSKTVATLAQIEEAAAEGWAGKR